MFVHTVTTFLMLFLIEITCIFNLFLVQCSVYNPELSGSNIKLKNDKIRKCIGN